MDSQRAAQLLGEQYVATGNVSAVLLAGSRGRGRADAFSDVELDVYWYRAPSDAQRRAPTAALGGTIVDLWPYDQEDAEWSEDVRVSGIGITVSGFTRVQVERWVHALAFDPGPSIVRQMRLSALHEGEVMYGADLVNEWRASSTYPRGLSIIVAESFLSADRLQRWRHWRALQHREDLVMLQRACADVADVILGTLCAVNRIYIEHPSFKWSRHLADRFNRAPAQFTGRFFAALEAGPRQNAQEFHALLKETVHLAERELPEVATVVFEELLHDRKH